MNILSFSYCFPHAAAPNWGVFVERRLAALAKRPGVALQVVAPVPSFPVVTRFRRGLVPAREQWHGLTVHRPRFFCVPGVLKSLDARLYARGLRRWMDAHCSTTRRVVDPAKPDRGHKGRLGEPEAGGERRLGESCYSEGQRLGESCYSQPDILDAHFVWPDGVGVSLLARQLGLPYVITLRGGLWVSFLNRRIKAQSVRALQGASAIISLSDSMVDVCCRLGVPREKFTVIHNGVDCSVFTPGDKLAARRRLGLPLDKKLIVCVAFYQERKGLLELLNALSRLSPEVELVLVGARVAHQRSFYRKVFVEIERLELQSRVRHEGQQPHARIPDYFRAADVTALPSYWEGCPNAVVESLACGTPVVVTPVGAVPDIIEPGRNGEIVPVRDTDALAAALGRVLDRPWDPDEVCRGVKSWDEIAQSVHAVLSRVSDKP